MHQRLLMLAFYFGTGLFGLAVSVWAVSVRAVSVWAVSVWAVSVWAVSVWAVSVWAVSVAGHSGLTIPVWGHFGHDISVHKQLITFVYLNDYIGRRNVTLAGVIPTPF